MDEQQRIIEMDNAQSACERRTVAVGLIDREACAGCVDETTPLDQCIIDYVDKQSMCVCCDNYRPDPESLCDSTQPEGGE